MAINENANKIIYGSHTLIDLTDDTIVPEALVSGYTAHDRSGATVTGTLELPSSSNPLPIEKGGTYANNIAEARTNLNVYSKEETLKYSKLQYCVCDTSAATRDKSITVNNVDSSSSIPYGYVVVVKMSNSQQYNGTPQLNVNRTVVNNGITTTLSLLNLPIYRANGVPAGLGEWSSGSVLTFVYGTSITEVSGAELIADVWYIVNGISNYLAQNERIATLAEAKTYLEIS